jgi:hypothetical protein
MGENSNIGIQTMCKKSIMFAQITHQNYQQKQLGQQKVSYPLSFLENLCILELQKKSITNVFYQEVVILV